MPEPAKDTAIDIAPKTEAPSGRVPKIVSEINRIASRVDGRNKKENDQRVLENDAQTRVDKVIVGLLVFINVLLVIRCHPPPLPYPTPSKIPPPSSETSLSSAAQEIVEYKEIKWNPLGYNPYQSFTTQQL